MKIPPLPFALGALVAAAGLAGCASLGAQSWLASTVPETPKLHESPPTQLPSPEGVRAISGELRSVPLKWDPLLAGDVGGYAIERSFDREGAFEVVAAVPGRLTTVYVDPTPSREIEKPEGEAPAALSDGVTAYYRVRAYSPTGQLSTAVSPVVAATTAPLPAAPDDLRAYSHQPRQVPLSWRASEDPHVVGYTIDRSPTYRGPFEPIADVEGRYESVFVDDGLGDLRVFYYRVSARNGAGGVGDPSEPVRAVTKPVPLPPIELRVVGRRLGANELAWDPNVEPDLSGYRLLRRREGEDTPEVVAELSRDELSAEDVGVGADEPVSYTVVALDGDGLASATASEIEVTSEGYGLAASARKDGVHLTWDARPDEGFVRARVVRRGFIRTHDLGFAEGGTFLDATAQPGAKYRYEVQLERADGTRAPVSTPVELRVPEQLASRPPRR